MADLWFPKKLSQVRSWARYICGEIEARTPITGLNSAVQQTKRGRAINVGPGGGIGGAGSHPFKVVRAPAPNPNDERIYVKVVLHSMLQKTAKPTDKITITGLDFPFEIEVDQYIWLEVNVGNQYNEPPTDISATIGHGDKWAEDTDIFPDVMRYNSGDGAYDPDQEDIHQTHFYVPIAYTVDGDNDPFAPLARDAGLDLGDNIFLVQQLRNHLILGTTCIDGASGDYAVVAPSAPMPEPS